MPGASQDNRAGRRPSHVDPEDEYLAEPASDEIFSGPVSESVPSSYSIFHHRRRYSSRSRRDESVDGERYGSVPRSPELAHRRSSSQRPRPRLERTDSLTSLDSQTSGTPGYFNRQRSDSLSSFKFFSQDEIEQAEGASTLPNEIDPVEYEINRRELEEFPDDDEYLPPTPHQHPNRYSYEQSHRHPDEYEEEVQDFINDTQAVSARKRQRSFDQHLQRWNTTESDEPLLSRINSRISQEFGDFSHHQPQEYDSARLQQRFYISEEDLVIVIAGYKTSRLRSLLYQLLCISTFGLAYLILRWLPRWRISCLGNPAPLGQCDWVVVENQWGELSVLDVAVSRYNRALSTVFRVEDSEKPADPDNSADPSVIDSENSNREDDAETIDDDPLLPTLRTIDYRYIKFFYHPGEDIFLTNFDWVDKSWVDVQEVREGIDNDTQRDRETVFGPNIIDINEKSTIQLLIDEVLHPFYIFQVFSIILWAFDEYYYYASCIFIISVISVGNTLIETKQTLHRMRELARFECDIRVLRSGYWTTVKSSELVAGDIYEVSDPSIALFPCDSILLSGDCIVNESMLTGESVPVSKSPATNEVLQQLVSAPGQGSNVSPELSKHFLYSGTKIVQVRRPQAPLSGPNMGSQLDVAVAMVARTGFTTTKGALVRSMLFPKPSGFKFYQDSFKYIGVMAVIAAFGFSFSTIGFIRMHMDTRLIILRALDLITIVVPPALPATLTIGTNISLSRLRNKLIFCISPSRVNVGGKLDIICFDKTGTLTEDGLDVLGIHVNEQLRSEKSQFSELLHSVEDVLPVDRLVFEGEIEVSDDRTRSAFMAMLTTCHSLRVVDDELVGDPLDLKMFEFTGWKFDEDKGASLFPADHTVTNPVSVTFPTEGGTYLGVIQSFEFVSKLRRMSVMVKAQNLDQVQVFVKGAPEVMPEVCDPSTFPADYDELLHYYTHRGYRVIACATKTYKGMTAEEARQKKRTEVESELTFMGFIVFENKLKPTTTAAIEELNNAEIRTVMCTGDNVLTAISVAKECKIVMEGAKVYVPHFHESEEEEEDFIQWECIDDRELTLDSITLEPISGDDYVLAVPGDAFRYIVQYGSTRQLEQMLMKGAIFARMSPDEKHELVEKLQALNYTTGFCGDGANDCGALKAADVGISLSEAEASVAAPFTSQVFDISCVLDVIKEGRSALVTSFSCFKYMSLYSAIQFVTVSILYSLGSNLGDFQFLWIDLFLIIPIAIFMGWAEPFPVLCVKRPTANLVSRKVLVPLMGEIAILGGIQFLVWYLVKQQTAWYTPPLRGGDDSEVQSSDNTALFMASCFQYIFVAVILSVGPPYRQPISKNKPFVITLIITVLCTVIIMLVSPDSAIGNLMDLTYISPAFKCVIIVLAAVNMIFSWVSEKWVFPLLATGLQKGMRIVGLPTKRESNKRYKRIKAEHIKVV